MTYSPTNLCSTIGADGLNFSVRNGKRWIPDAIDRLNKCTVHLLYTHRKKKNIFFTELTQVNNPCSNSQKRSRTLDVCSRGQPHRKKFLRGKKSLRAISTARLNMLPCLHLQPINVVVYDDPNEEI